MNVSGRVLPLELGDDNMLDDAMFKGEVKKGERVVLLTPTVPLNKMTTGDIISIPWGIRPNTWSPPAAPAGTGPAIIIGSPSGNQLLKWNGTQFAGDTLTLGKDVEDNWCFTGEVEFCFSTTNFICETFPDGYSWVRATGPLANFKIIKLDIHEDDKGRISFYSCQVEHEDQKGLILQE